MNINIIYIYMNIYIQYMNTPRYIHTYMNISINMISVLYILLHISTVSCPVAVPMRPMANPRTPVISPPVPWLPSKR